MGDVACVDGGEVVVGAGDGVAEADVKIDAAAGVGMGFEGEQQVFVAVKLLADAGEGVHVSYECID